MLFVAFCGLAARKKEILNMRVSVRLALVAAFGLPGVLQAAENLPPLRVDPALLGGGVAPARPKPAPVPSTPPAVEAKPVAAPEATVTQPAQSVPQPVPQPAQAVVAEPVKVQPDAQAEKKPLPAGEAKPAAAATAPAAAPPPAQQATQAAAQPAVQPAPAKLESLQVNEPPQVEERPALPPLYSAHAKAGLVPPLKDGQSADGATFINAARIDGRNDNEVVAEGAVELRRSDAVLTADRLTYWKIEDEAEAEGSVRYVRGEDKMSGPKLRLNLTENTGFFEQPSYSVTRPGKEWDDTSMVVLGASTQPVRHLSSFLPREKTSASVASIAGEFVDARNLTTASGKADRIELQSGNRLRLTNATYSTCVADDPDWYARMAELDLDYDQEVGEGRDATVLFKGVPIFHLPWLSFALNNKRKSGFLAPTFGTSSKSGVEFTLPYYWDIAPNMDLTIAPRVMTKRGLQINSELRYLDHDYRGRVHAEWMPDDRLAGRQRYGYSILHEQTNLGYGFSGVVNISGVSDHTYLRDLSTRITEASQGNLLRQGVLSYNGWWGTATVNLQTYQTLQDPALPPVLKPYQRLPQVTLVSNREDFFGGTAFAFSGEYVNFDHPTLDTARRLTLYPQLSLPLMGPSWHLTPKIGLHSTRYEINRRSSVGPDNISRNLPVFSVDAGLAFERDVNWFGENMAQTLEPRLYYLAVPQRTQDQIPIFDSGLADFNFATIFSDNIYSGVDRIADANQLTAALTSRLIDAQTGEEYLRGMIGQRYYFAKQHVTLPGESARPSGASDFLAALSGRVMSRTYADVAWQYNPRDRETERFAIGGRWQPDFAKVLNASYRYTRDHALTGGTPGIRQVDFSGQWPLGRNWYGVGRFNYSLKEKRIIETIGGLEYNGGCWVGRLVLQRYATATGDTNTALFVQLELNDFAKIGSNPLDLLARRIAGYGRINQVPSNPVFGNE